MYLGEPKPDEGEEKLSGWRGQLKFIGLQRASKALARKGEPG